MSEFILAWFGIFQKKAHFQLSFPKENVQSLSDCLFCQTKQGWLSKKRWPGALLLFRARDCPLINSVFLHNILHFMYACSRLQGRRFSRWRRVWRTSFLGRAKWSTWFAPWSRRRQLTRRPLNACVHAFPLTLWQMWRWPRSKLVPTEKPKLQPKSPDSNRGLAALPRRLWSKQLHFSEMEADRHYYTALQMLLHFFLNVWWLD